MRIPVADLISIFQSNNIPDSYVRTISEADAFRRASSSIKNRILLLNAATEKVRVEVDEVKSDYEGIKRIIGVKKVDEVAEDISYQPVGEIIFNRANNLCTATPLFAPAQKAHSTLLLEHIPTLVAVSLCSSIV